MLEVELKYKFEEPAVLQRWASLETLENGLRIEPIENATVCVRDTYLDTPDYRLLRNGFGLRHRRKGDRSLLTLKSILLEDRGEGAPKAGRRLEIERPLVDGAACDDIARYPDEIRTRIAPFLTGSLRPIAALVQTREKRLMSLQQAAETGEGRRSSEVAVSGRPAEPFTAELSIDHVEILAPAGIGAGGQKEEPVGSFFELEIELLTGDEAYLTEIAHVLADDPELHHHRRSKLEEALDRIAEHQPGTTAGESGLDPAMPMSEAGRTILRKQLNRMIQLEPGVRLSDDSEYVHQMRVAIRRSRAAARVFAVYLSPKRLKEFNRILRKTGRKLGRVRDLDVALEKGRRTGTIDPALEKQWHDERDQNHDELITWLDSKRYARFVAEYDRFCRTPGKGARVVAYVPGKSPPRIAVAHVAPSLICTRFEQIRAYEPIFADSEPVPYATVHALRIDCKHLRYTLEFFAELMGTDAAQLIEHLRKLQDLLGDLNDAVVAAELLESEIAADRTPGTVLKQHLAHQQDIIQELSARVPHELEQFTRPKSRRRLGRAITRI